MSVVTVAAAGVLGAAAGAFLPVEAYRRSVPADEPDRAACEHCGEPITWRDRCSKCGQRLGPPAWLTASVAGVACALVAAALGPVPVLPLFVGACVLGVLLGAIDAKVKRLPHALVMPAIGVTAASLTVIAAVTGDWDELLRAGLGAAVLGAAFLILFLVPGQGLGFGDVKLAVWLGLPLGWLGWREVLLGALLPWLVNAPVVLWLLFSRRVGRKSSLPFGPAMLVGALFAVLVSAWVDMVGRL